MITHLNKKNKPKIVDITNKKITKRNAIAQGTIKFTKQIFTKIEKMKTKKGEINNIAIIAGIIAAKKTSDLIPLCHNIHIDNINIDLVNSGKKEIWVSEEERVLLSIAERWLGYMIGKHAGHN